MITISVKSELEKHVSQWARVAGDQMPIATAVALTRSAKAGKEEIERQMPSIIDRPTPWTQNGFMLFPAKKTKLRASVEFRISFRTGSGGEDYLSPIVYGGTRKLKAFEKSLARTGLLPAGYSALPGSGASLDAYGNMSRGQIVQILSYFKAFGEQGYSANITDKRKDRMALGTKKARGKTYFVGSPGGGRLPLGVWQRTSFGGMGSSIKPLIIFVSKVRYRKQFDVPAIAQKVVLERFPIELKRSVAQFLQTRMPRIQPSLF